MYCYSWWIVPHNYPKIMRDYGMTHIPHITLTSNMSFPRSHKDTGKEFNMRFQGDIVPLYPQGYGVMCDIDGWGAYSMTMGYTGKSSSTKNDIGFIMGIFCCADTRNPNPAKWKIMTEKV